MEIESGVQPSIVSIVERVSVAFKTSMILADPFLAAQCKEV